MQQAAVRNLVRVLFHTIPLVPLIEGRLYLTIAAVLLVTIPYIKVNKLDLQLKEQGDTKLSDAEIKSIEKASERWRYLTFLSG